MSKKFINAATHLNVLGIPIEDFFALDNKGQYELLFARKAELSEKEELENTVKASYTILVKPLFEDEDFRWKNIQQTRKQTFEDTEESAQKLFDTAVSELEMMRNLFAEKYGLQASDIDEAMAERLPEPAQEGEQEGGSSGLSYDDVKQAIMQVSGLEKGKAETFAAGMLEHQSAYIALKKLHETGEIVVFTSHNKITVIRDFLEDLMELSRLSYGPEPEEEQEAHLNKLLAAIDKNGPEAVVESRKLAVYYLELILSLQMDYNPATNLVGQMEYGAIMGYKADQAIIERDTLAAAVEVLSKENADLRNQLGIIESPATDSPDAQPKPFKKFAEKRSLEWVKRGATQAGTEGQTL